jgi:hypothetical protein
LVEQQYADFVRYTTAMVERTADPEAILRRFTRSKSSPGCGHRPGSLSIEGSKLLDAITVDDDSADWVESDLVGAGELVERLQISRGTLNNWRKARKIIAFRKGLRNFVYPLRQFERRRPVEGLDLVAPFFASSEETWEWLVAPNRMTHDKPPIEALRDGNVALVTSAAEGALDYA